MFAQEYGEIEGARLEIVESVTGRSFLNRRTTLATENQ